MTLSPKQSFFHLLYVVCFFSVLPCGNAQDKRAKEEPKTERDIRLQERFIAATREKVLNNFEKADTMLQHLAADAPQNAEVAFQWATVLYSMKKYEQSLAQAQKAYDLSNKNQYFAEFYAERLSDKGEFKKSAQIYNAFTKVQPNNKHLYLQEGLMYVKAEDTDNALKAFNMMETKIGINEESSKRKHILYDAIGKKDKAAQELIRLIQQFPTEISYRHDLADYYKSIKEFNKATDVYKEILKVKPTDSKAMFAVTKNAGQKGDELAYVKAMKGLFSRNDVTAETKIKQLLSYLEEQSVNPEVMTEALACAEILAQTHPKDAQALSFYGDLLYKNNKKKEALTQYQASAVNDKKRFYPWQYILIINTELNNFDEVLKQSEVAMDYFPNQPLVPYMAGVANYQKGKYSAALDRFEETIPMLTEKSSMRQDVYHQLARTLTALKKYEKAAAAWQIALQGSGQIDPATQEHYGDFLFTTNKTDEAVKTWQSALQLGSRSEKLQQKIAQRKLNVD